MLIELGESVNHELTKPDAHVGDHGILAVQTIFDRYHLDDQERYRPTLRSIEKTLRKFRLSSEMRTHIGALLRVLARDNRPDDFLPPTLPGMERLVKSFVESDPPLPGGR